MPSTYQKKYWYTFGTLDGKVNKVELWQYTDTVLTAEEIKGAPMPFSIEMPEIDHKFQVVRGTGCEINLLSATDRKFFTGLYHTDMREFRVQHYIKNAGAGDETYILNWLGYLNSEMVRESYSEYLNYYFQITGNDGFSLLDRLRFVDGSGDDYTGIKTKMELLMICIDSIQLPYGDIYVCLSTTFTGQLIEGTTSLLHQSYINCANFYDEDGEPETMRKVLESILAPYGAIVTLLNTDIYIADVNTLASGESVFKRFDGSNGEYVQDVTITLTKDIADIGYMGTGSDIEMSGGKNKQVVSYSPYPFKNAIPNSLYDALEFSGFGEWVYEDFYYKISIAENSKWTDEVGSGLLFEGSKNSVNETPNLYMKIIHLGGGGGGGGFANVSKLKSPLILSIPANVVDAGGNVIKGVKLNLSGDCLYRSQPNPYAPFQQGDPYSFMSVTLEITCGSLYYVGGNSPYDSGVWQAEAGIYTMVSSKKDNSTVNNQWINIGQAGEGIDIKFPDGISGSFNVMFTNNTSWTGDQWYKNLKFSFTDYNNAEVADSDIEYIGYLDKTVKEEAEKVELICGTDATFIDRGKIMYLDGTDYKSIATWIRSAQTFKIEELLLNSLSSNYRRGYLTITNLKLKNLFNQLNILTDTGILGAKYFMVKSQNINFRDNLIETSIVEIQPDSLTIVPYV